MQLPKPLDTDEAKALRRLMESREFELFRGWLDRNASAYLEQSCNPASDAVSRQAQGAWMALNGILKTAEAITHG